MKSIKPRTPVITTIIVTTLVKAIILISLPRSFLIWSILLSSLSISCLVARFSVEDCWILLVSAANVSAILTLSPALLSFLGNSKVLTLVKIIKFSKSCNPNYKENIILQCRNYMKKIIF